MKCAVILLCAGKGERLRRKEDKAFVKIGNLPLFYRSYSVFSRLKYFSQIIIAAGRNYFPLIKRYTKNSRVAMVTGGPRRQDSVYRGLTLVKHDIDYVFIHDGARPFVTKELVEKVKDNVIKFNAVVPGIRLKDAVKAAERKVVSKNINRGNLWYIQTPQAFNKGLLIDAYNKFSRKDAHDDAEIVMRLGKKIRIVEGDYFNMKITYPEDLLLAEAILKVRNIRVGS